MEKSAPEILRTLHATINLSTTPKEEVVRLADL